MATFSYAQAAKGLAPGSSAEHSKAATPPSTVQKRATSVSDAAETQNPERHSTDTREVSVNGNEETASKPLRQTDDDVKQSISRPSSPSGSNTLNTTLPKEDDPSSTPNGTSDSTWDKQSQVSSSVDRSSQATEVSKDKPTENGWDKNPPPAKELKAAPIPAVNVWQQRREAQAAKAKAMSTANPTPAASASKNATTKSVGTNTQSASDQKGTFRRKHAETVTENAGGAHSRDRKKQTDGAKSKSDVVVTSADDTVSWPTPQLAQGESQKKPQAKSQQTEKSDKEKSVKSHQGKEKWMPVPYVPSAVFSTPLPSAARRGGRSARGGRENGAHAAGGNTRDKSAGPSPANSKKSQTPDRGHDRGVSENPKAAGQESALNPVSNAGGAEQRKNAQGPHTEHGNKDAKFGKRGERHQHYQDENRNIHSNAPEHSLRSRQESKSFSKGQDFPNMRLHGEGQGQSRYGVNHDRHFESGPRSADFYKDPGSFGQGRDREYQRNDVHRDRGESRSERGRGGYRGRGGHSNYNGPQNPPYHSAPITQHPFPPPKTFTPLNDRHRPHNHGSNNRVNIRSPSMPSPSMYGAGPYPIQTDMNAVYGYPHVPQGPMTAMHYQPYMEQFSLMSMISMQLEYYFSVDNLCKDLFLRKHMDSQGFVLLSVIANFKRIKSLTEDMELLRLVCRQLKNVEHRPSEDGSDRLRKREKWEQWVLNMEMRDPTARNEGPAHPTTPFSADAAHDGFMNTVQTDGSAPYTNGVSHSTPVTAAPHQYAPADVANASSPSRPAKLSSTAPEFMPLMAPPAQNDNINVRNTVDESPFPDEQIENLVIVVRKPGPYSPTPSPFLIPSSLFSPADLLTVLKQQAEQ